MRHIGIIGGGFSGTLTAIQLIQKCAGPLKITVISDGETLNRGIAFHPYSKKHLLNVMTQHMSAFPDRPTHFLDWVMLHPNYHDDDRTLIGLSFLPRYIFGEYLVQLWEKAKLLATQKSIQLQVIDSWVTYMDREGENIHINTSLGHGLFCHEAVIATGNQLPRNHSIPNKSFYTKSENYFQNPWDPAAVGKLPNHLPILLIGNGLTMVDTVLGLLESGFSEKIISVSPNGFNLLPHRHNGISYNKLIEETTPGMNLLDWLNLVNKHRKKVRKLGVSAEPIIDSLRSHSQDIWRNLTLQEKELFMRRLRHLWGVARHRVPLQIHDRIQNLRLQKKLDVYAGRILNMVDGGDFVRVEIKDKNKTKLLKIDVARVINCSGPESDISLMEEHTFLKNCLKAGIIRQDTLKIGIDAEWPGMRVLDINGNPQPNIYTLGNNLRGILWESTAVKELREQAEALADILKEKIKQYKQNPMDVFPGKVSGS
jgi:uncharacterized NAD(P)/FAD-binding protein YdhS